MNSQPHPDWDPKSPEVLRDQRAAYDAMRRRCPVAYSEFMGWSLFRHEDVTRALHDHETFSNAVSQHLSVPNGMDPPEHTAYRRVIEPYFSPSRMEAFRPVCREIAAKLVRDSSARGEVEFIADAALPFAVQVQCAFLGWPPALQEPLVQWTRKNHEATLAQDRKAMSEIALEFEGTIDDLLETRLQAGTGPEVDLTASLMHEKVWGRTLSNEEVASILRNWTVGEIGTISAAVGILAHYLADHAELQKRLRAQPDVLPPAIEEILRIHGPLVANRRITTRPVEIGGRKIKAGERLTLMWITANRDERVFDDPDPFRLDRDPGKNLLYGAGIHACPGAPLARLELRLFTEELLAATTEISPIAEKKPTPALAQFLIYGPVPGTPFYERVMKENLLHDVYIEDPERMYRRGDGFTTLVKHPTLSPEAIERIQRWCFEEDFQRLGPSIYRVLEARLLGYQKLKNSRNPLLRAKAEYYARELRVAYPVFLAGRLLGPNAAVRSWIADLERRVHAELGGPVLAERCQSVIAVGAALWTSLTLKLDLFQHPKLIRTTYRLPDKRWSAFEMWEELQRKVASPDFSVQVELQHARQQVWLRLEGALSANDAEGLAHRIHESLTRSKNRLVLDFNKLHWNRTTDLEPLRKMLADYRSRIRVVLPKLSAAHPEIILLASMFHHYRC